MRGRIVMRKSILTVLLGLVMSGSLKAQDSNKTYAGLKLGLNMPRMYYTNQNLKDLPHDFSIGPSFGLFAEFPLGKRLAVAAELNFQKRGGATSYTYETDYKVKYDIQTMYVSLRIPFYWYLTKPSRLAPYLLLGPDAGYAFNGDISLSQPGLAISESNVSINNSNYNPYYLGVIAGVGARYNIDFKGFILVTKLDVVLNWGLLDTFSHSEHEGTSTPTNVNAYQHQGERYSRGVEVSLSLGFIRKHDMSACRGF